MIKETPNPPNPTTFPPTILPTRKSSTMPPIEPSIIT